MAVVEEQESGSLTVIHSWEHSQPADTPFVAIHCMHMDNNLALGPITWCYGHTTQGLHTQPGAPHDRAGG